MAKHHSSTPQSHTFVASFDSSSSSSKEEPAQLVKTLLNPNSSPAAKIDAALKLKAYTLSLAEEASLIDTIHSEKASSDEIRRAKDKLYQSLYASIYFIALKNGHHCQTLEAGDLFNHGITGVQEALNQYDPAKANGAKFSSYSHNHITNAITNACKTFSRTVSPTIPQWKRILELQHAIKEFKEENGGREPTVDELSARLPGFSPKFIRENKKGVPNNVSLDDSVNPNDPDNKTTFQELYDKNHSSNSFLDETMRKERYDFLHESLARLDKRTQLVLKYRFWDGLKLEEVGKLLSMSTQSINRIEKAGLRQLRALMTLSDAVA